MFESIIKNIISAFCRKFREAKKRKRKKRRGKRKEKRDDCNSPMETIMLIIQRSFKIY